MNDIELIELKDDLKKLISSQKFTFHFKPEKAKDFDIKFVENLIDVLSKESFSPKRAQTFYSAFNDKKVPTDFTEEYVQLICDYTLKTAWLLAIHKKKNSLKVLEELTHNFYSKVTENLMKSFLLQSGYKVASLDYYDYNLNCKYEPGEATWISYSGVQQGQPIYRFAYTNTHHEFRDNAYPLHDTMSLKLVFPVGESWTQEFVDKLHGDLEQFSKVSQLELLTKPISKLNATLSSQ